MLHRAVGEKFIREYESAELPPIEMPVTGQHGALREMLTWLAGGATPQGACHDNVKSFAMQAGAIASAEGGQRVPLTE